MDEEKYIGINILFNKVPDGIVNVSDSLFGDLPHTGSESQYGGAKGYSVLRSNSSQSFINAWAENLSFNAASDALDCA